MPHCVLDESMPCDSLKSRLERQFLASEGSLDDDVDISQQVASLSVSDCISIVMQLLSYFDACVSQLKHRVSFVQFLLQRHSFSGLFPGQPR